MRRARLATTLVVTALGVSLAACGGDASGPEAAADAFMTAFGEADADKICESTLDEDGKPMSGDALDECTTLWEGLFSEASDMDLEEARTSANKVVDEGPTDVKEDGDSASVTYESDGDKETLELRKVDGSWYVKTF